MTVLTIKTRPKEVERSEKMMESETIALSFVEEVRKNDCPRQYVK